MAPRPLTVACVLKAGGHYSPIWVTALERQVRQHLPRADFVCLTDMLVPGTWTIPLLDDWPGWWSKMELFRPGLFRTRRVLYFDLDTLIVGDLSDIASYDGDFAMIRDVYRKDRLQSGVMAWTPGDITELLWVAWIKRARPWIEEYRQQNKGQGWWMCDLLEGHVDVLQDLYPGQIESLKPVDSFTVRTDRPENCRVLMGHGKPRLDDPAAGWAHDYWRGMCRPETPLAS